MKDKDQLREQTNYQKLNNGAFFNIKKSKEKKQENDVSVRSNFDQVGQGVEESKKAKLSGNAASILQIIDQDLETINQIKQYAKLSKDVKRKERIIKETMKENLLQSRTPAKKEFYQLSKRLQVHLRNKESRSEDDAKTLNRLKLIEFKLKSGLASNKDLKLIINSAEQGLSYSRKQQKDALSGNASDEKVNMHKKDEEDIQKGLEKVADKIKYSEVEKKQAELLKKVEDLERSISHSVKKNKKREDVGIKSPLPPKDNNRGLSPEKLLDFVKKHHTVEYQHPWEIERKAGFKNDKLKERNYKQASFQILDRAQKALNKDQLIADYDGRVKERSALIEQIVTFSEGAKKDLESKLKRDKQNPLINKDFKKIGGLIDDSKKSQDKKKYKSIVTRAIKEQARGLQFDNKNNSKKQKPRNR